MPKYTKTSEYWEHSSLADRILEAVNGGLYSYKELREWATTRGWDDHTFVQTISNLRTEGKIETRCGGLYPGEYTGEDWT